MSGSVALSQQATFNQRQRHDYSATVDYALEDREVKTKSQKANCSRGYTYFERIKYVYEPLHQLNTIRLLRINPSQEKDEILSCNLETVNIQSTTSYEALSYRWYGRQDRVLCCNGRSLSIRRNLYNALKQLQLTNRHRSIWTDAICINQNDEKEKAEQIQIMREIHKKATRVIVWLGTDPDNKADKAFDRITRIANDGNTLPGPYDSWWNPVAHFYNNAWFERLWVFQEITAASAADVLWRASKIPWKTVGRASTRMRTTLYHHILHCSTPNVYHAYLFYKWSDMNEHQNQPESFLFMLQITRKLQSSKNKDRIYALAGFRTVDTNPADFQGPLDSRRRLQSIYQEFAKKVLTRMGTLDILSAVQHDANKPIILKSTWVPRWHIYSAETIHFKISGCCFWVLADLQASRTDAYVR